MKKLFVMGLLLAVASVSYGQSLPSPTYRGLTVTDHSRVGNNNAPTFSVDISEALNYTASYVTHYGFILTSHETTGGTGDRIGMASIQTCDATLSGKSCVGGSDVAVAGGTAVGNYTGSNPRVLIPAGLTGPVGAAVGIESDVETHSPVLIKNGLRIGDENQSGGVTTHGSIEDAGIAIVNDSGNTAQGFNVGIQVGEGAQGYYQNWPILPNGTILQAVNPNVALNYGIDFSLMTGGFSGGVIALPAATTGNGIVWGGNGHLGGSIASTATSTGGHLVFTDAGIIMNNASGGTVLNVGGSTGADVVNQGYETQYSLTGYVYCNGSAGRCTASPTIPQPIYSVTGTALTNAHTVIGVQALSQGSTVAFFSGSAAFTSFTTYACTANDTVSSYPVLITKNSGTQVTFSVQNAVQNATDPISFICIGN